MSGKHRPGKHAGGCLATIVGVMVTALVLGGVVACSDAHESAPEPAATNIVEGTHTQVIKMSDGFRNVAFTCYGANGVYVASHGGGAQTSSIYVVVNDAHCVG